MRWGLFLLFSFCSALTSYADTSPIRIVSVGGAVTEWVVSLGDEDKLVGVDTTSLFPASVRKLTKIGYQRQLNAEGIASLKPSLVIGTKEMGPEATLKQLETLGIHIDLLSNEPSLDALASNLAILGKVLNKEQEAKQRLDQYKQSLIENDSTVIKAQKNQVVPRVLLVMTMQGSLLASGTDTTADWLINKAGGKNVVTFSGYKVLSNEALVSLNPDILIVADKTGSDDKALIDKLYESIPVLKMTKAVKNNKVFTLDASLLVAGLGPRLPAEVTKLTNIFYDIPAIHQ